MEDQTTNNKSIVLNYGMTLAGFSILIQLVQFSMGQHFSPHWSYSVISTLITVGIIVQGIKAFKTTNHGAISFGQSVKTGIGISLFSAIIYSLYLLIFMNFIDPDFLSKLWAIEEGKMLNRGMSEEQIEASMRMVNSWGIYFMFATVLIISILMGFVISAITGAILKKEVEN
jgi:hypothetical protein